MPMDWDKLRVFHAVAEAGSFTHAGEQLHLSQSAVSRQVSGLEESLDSMLFHRHARGLKLTEQGELLYRTVHDVFAKLASTEALLGDLKSRPQGPLKVTTTIAMGSLWLTPRLGEFLDMYPEIQVSLLTTDGEVDLTMREADCSIRLSPARHADLIQRKLTEVSIHVFASPDYIKAHGMPKCEEDLDKHRLIVFGDAPETPAPYVNWLLQTGKNGRRPRKAALAVNNVYGILRATESGLGVSALPDFLANEVPNLVRILPELEGPQIEVFFVYPEELRHSRRLEVFRDFLLRKISETHFAAK